MGEKKFKLNTMDVSRFTPQQCLICGADMKKVKKNPNTKVEGVRYKCGGFYSVNTGEAMETYRGICGKKEKENSTNSSNSDI